MYKYAATGECALLLRYLLCPSPCHIHRVATPSSPPTYPDILLSCKWKWWIGQEKCRRKFFFLIFWIARLHWGLEVDCRFGKTGFWWSLMPAEVSANYLLAASRQLFTPWVSTQHVAAIGQNILNQEQGTKCKCESVLPSWISINHNHALNIIIEKTVNSCVRVWNAEFSITHLYKFPDD